MALFEGIRERLGAAKAGLDDGLKPIAPRLKAGFASLADRFSKNRARVLYSPAGSPAARGGEAPDPARILFPAEASFAASEFAAHPPGSLGDSLQASAKHIADSQIKLAERARTLSRALSDRLDGEATLIAQGFRILIATVWAFFAFILAWTYLTRDPSWTAFVGPIAPADAALLSQAFAIIAGAGMAVAFLRAFIVFSLGKGNNNLLRARSSELGDEAAEIALEFDRELDRWRRAMDGRQHNPADAVQDLSRAHLTALEAAVFFRGVQFLTDADRGEAARKFRGYLKSHARGGAGGVAIPMFFFGFFFGAVYVSTLYPAPPAVLGNVPIPTIANYPWALLLILGGALVYALSGLLVDAFRDVFTGPAERQARDEALDAVRSGFIARNAPRIESVIQRIVDALDVYKARVAGARKTTDSATHSAEEIPEWRRGPEPPRFVETPFAAAPKAWRTNPPPGSTDATERREKEIFSVPGGPQNTPPKRSLFGLKKPS